MTKQLFVSGLALCTGLLLGQSAQQNEPMQPSTNSSTQQMSSSGSAGNSWVGLLVASGCDATTGSGSMSASASGTTSGSPGSAMTGPALNGSNGAGMNGTSTNMTGTSATSVNQTPTAGNSAAQATGTADRAAGASGATTMPSDQNFPKSTASAAHESSATMNRATDATAGMARNTSDKGVGNAGNGSGTEGSWDEAKTMASQMGPSCHISPTTSSFALRLSDGRVIPFDSASNAKIADQVRSRVSDSSSKIFRAVVKGTMTGNTISADSVRL